MKQAWAFAIALFVTLYTASSLASTHENRLFQDWYFGQHMDEFPVSEGYYDCSHEIGEQALCLDDVIFLQQPFLAELLFSSDQTLLSVTLYGYYTDDLYATALGGLLHSFAVVHAQGWNETFDLVALLNQGAFSDENSFEAALTAFEIQQIQEGYFSITLAEHQAVEEGFNVASDIDDFLLNMRDNARAVDLSIYEDDQWGQTLEMHFLLPGQHRNRFIDKVRHAPVEDF